MGVGLLGPVEIWAASDRLVAGTPRQCTVLAVLAADVGRLVPVDALVDRVWGDDPPERARRTLHTYIARIRRLIEQVSAAADRPAGLVRRAGGYALDLPPGQVDLHRFRRMVQQAADPACDDAHRLTLLRGALRMWRGDALAGVPGDWADRTRRSWQ